MGFKWGQYYFGGLGNLPGYGQMLAQANQSVEQQLAYMRSLQHAPVDTMTALMSVNFFRPNPTPWETRYADFCERLITVKQRQEHDAGGE